jgi:hypothetical protein
MTAIRLLLLAILLTSCSAERRLQRLVERNPDLQRTDTITVTMRVPIPADTVRQVVTLTDTVVVENERQVVTIVRVPTGSPCDTLPVLMDVQGVVKADTVWASKEVYVDRIVPCPPGKRVAAWWRTAALVLAAMWVVFAYLDRRR